jgi:ribosome-associated heat shock protein Hsp15
MRADVFLHHIRVFKTRTLSTQACLKGNVLILGQAIKPARNLKAGDEMEVERGDLKLVLRVLDFPLRRLSPPQVATFVENLTPEENYHRAAEARRLKEMTSIGHDLPKPDKKQLRQIREWMDQSEDGS